MKHRPLALVFAALLFLYFPIRTFWEVSHGEPLTSADVVLSFIFPVVLVTGLLFINRLAWYTLFGFVFLLGIRDFKGLQEETQNLSQVLTHLFVYILGVGYFINPKVKRLYFDPKLQWWRTKERFEVHGPAILECEDRILYAQLKNISEGGCFLETAQPLDLYQTFQLIVPLSKPLPEASLRFKGQVRWSSPKPDCPGMGIQFLNLEKDSLKKLKKFIRVLS